jgi:serine/threonine-protein kinase
MFMRRLPPVLLCYLLLGGAPLTVEADAPRGYDVLRKYCYDCHGQRLEKRPLDVGNRTVLVAPGPRPYVVAGRPEESYLWQRVDAGDMPPDSRPQPSAEEKEALRGWIAAGAPFPEKARRPLRGDHDVLAAIVTDLREVAPQDRRFQRYFTLTHLFSNPDVSDGELRLVRAALSKVLNSLTWSRDLVVPRAVDPEEGTIYAVDLRRLGWVEDDLWGNILERYPYGLRYDTGTDPFLRDLYGELTRLSASDRPYVRADWFIATASRPPLYHALLQLPDRAADLEQLLGVDAVANFQANRLVRAAVIRSGVSRQNRVVERHPSRHGAYWKSYDFLSSTGTGNVLRAPLGPVFPGNAFAPELAFVQAGGEIIFTLPNGLQGYLLVDKDDRRINDAPAQVVEDSKRTSGSGIIVNGLSCMACHQHGMLGGFRNVVQPHAGLPAAAAAKVARLYREPAVMDGLLRHDEERFLDALTRTIGPFLQVDEDRSKEVGVLPEPIGPAVQRYLRELDAQAVACELGLRDGRQLRQLLSGQPALLRLGLGAVVQGEAIKREVWEQAEGASLYQEAARALRLGTPEVSLKAR